MSFKLIHYLSDNMSKLEIMIKSTFNVVRLNFAVVNLRMKLRAAKLRAQTLHGYDEMSSLAYLPSTLPFL